MRGPVDFRHLFDVFSRRTGKAAAMPRKPLTPIFRNRVLMLCRDRFSSASGGDYTQDLWMGTHRRFAYLLGRHRLSNHHQGVQSEIEDILHFVSECNDEHFLDFI
jgi:hypothetical protein